MDGAAERCPAGILHLGPVRLASRLTFTRWRRCATSHHLSFHLDSSVHNVRIERLWVDVTTQFGAKWADFFHHLEVHHGLDVNNRNHLWLVHYLYLHDINGEASMFAETWNRHKIQMRGQATRSPIDMFYFDSITNGVRGDALSEEELATFGVDWEGLREDRVLSSQLANNPIGEGTSSWIGRVGPPPDLGGVHLEAPGAPVSQEVADGLFHSLHTLWGSMEFGTLVQRWVHGVAYCRSQSPLF